ncbi:MULTISPECIES: hypothetical protein [Candidatus Ichthyocystis]|uniref:Uncharacterized protein n=1 Tax=Candidatus Ichthyocystis hellenicum TaxID=1561003 RepID=A0A0S4M3W6_9BURK|nr:MULTISPECIES: hypothetical protein [Ichthyocystis]CUT17660.1 hypothetical protein Ark11_0837 [Candidatus Ichthyocystis hellenicum]
MDNVHIGSLEYNGVNDVGGEFCNLHGETEKGAVEFNSNSLFSNYDVSSVRSGLSISAELLHEMQEFIQLQGDPVSQGSDLVSVESGLCESNHLLQEKLESHELQSVGCGYGHGFDIESIKEESKVEKKIVSNEIGFPTSSAVFNYIDISFPDANSVFADCDSTAGGDLYSFDCLLQGEQGEQGVQEFGQICNFDLVKGGSDVERSITSDVGIPFSTSEVTGSVYSSVKSSSSVLLNRFLSNTEEEKKIIGEVGLNIHSYDYSNILLIKKKFLSSIKGDIGNLFSVMLERGFVFPSGKVLSRCMWRTVYGELWQITVGLLDPIIRETCKNIDEILSQAHVLDVCSVDPLYRVARKITDTEKCSIVECVKEFIIYKSLRSNIRSIWSRVIKNSKYDFGNIGYGYTEKDTADDNSGIGGSWGVKLRYIDNAAILNIRRSFSRKIRICINSKFSEMIENKYKFEDGTIIDKSPWSLLSKKLLPIAKEETKYIIEDERKEIGEFLSEARVDIGKGSDRELTNEEIGSVLHSIIKLVLKESNSVFRSEWLKLICSSEKDVAGVSSSGVQGDDFNSKSFSMVNKNDYSTGSFFSFNRSGVNGARLKFGASFHHEDDSAISDIRSNFSRIIGRCVSSKFYEMIRGNYIFDDGTAIGLYPWRELSKKLVPVIEKEIEPIIEEERLRINEVLLEARVQVCSPDGSSSYRGVTFDERPVLLENILRFSSRHARSNFRRSWGNVIRSLKCKHLKENTNLAKDLSCLSSTVVKEDFKSSWESVLKSLEDKSCSKVNNLSGDVSSTVDKTSTDYILGTNVDYCSYDFYSVSKDDSLQKISFDDVRSKYDELGVDDLKIVKEWNLSIYPDDYVDILSAKKKFENNIVAGIRYFLFDMFQKKFVIPNGKFLFKCSWNSVSSMLCSLLKESLSSVINHAYKELDAIISCARLVVIGDRNDLRIVRESTDNEKNILRERARSIVSEIFKSHIKSEWLNITNDNLKITEHIYCYDVKGNCKIDISCGDAASIFNIRKKFASKISSVVDNKFYEMVINKHEFCDGTVISLSPWRSISKKLLPVIKKEVDPIIKCERTEIRDVLSVSLAIVYNYGDGSSTTRKLIPGEVSNFVEIVMASVDKSMYLAFTKSWRSVLKSLKG